jgi:hypothetical protein
MAYPEQHAEPRRLELPSAKTPSTAKEGTGMKEP